MCDSFINCFGIALGYASGIAFFLLGVLIVIATLVTLVMALRGEIK